MNINWIRRNADWAFGNLCNHLVKKMPKHDHKFDGKNGDVNFICSPNFLKRRNGDKLSVLHLDSNRWYEQTIKGL